MKHGSCIILLWSNLNWNRCIPYVAYVRVREYSLTKTYILLLEFPVKGKIFHRKKTYNVTSSASHKLAHLSSSPWRAWKLVQRKLVVGTFSYQGRHKEWPHQLSNWFNHQTNKKLKPVLQMWPSVNLTLFDPHCRKQWLVWCHDWITHEIMSVEQT